VPDEKPLLEPVLEHYGVVLNGRRVQMAQCCFHQDDTPSMSVNLNRQLWRCHSCNRGGDVYTLVEEKEETDYRGAVAALAALGLEAGPGANEEVPNRFVSRRGGDGATKGRYRPRFRRP